MRFWFVTSATTLAAAVFAIAAPVAAADGLTTHVGALGGATAPPSATAGAAAQGSPPPTISSATQSPAGGPPPGTPLPSSNGSVSGQPPATAPAAVAAPATTSTATTTTTTNSATGGGPRAGAVRVVRGSGVSVRHATRHVVRGSGAAPASLRRGRALGAGRSPAGKLPFTGPRNVIALLLAALGAMVAGAVFYRKASRRERAVQFIAARFQWRPTQHLGIEPAHVLAYEPGAPAFAPPLPQPVSVDDDARFAWAAPQVGAERTRNVS